MRKLTVVVILLLFDVSCRAENEIVAQNGDWVLVRSARSHEGNGTQYYYDLRYRDRAVAVAGDLLSPLGTLTMAAPTDRFSDAGWIRPQRSLSSIATVEPPVTDRELKLGYYDTQGKYRRHDTPRDWIFQWFEPSKGRWMAPEKLFDPTIALVKPPAEPEVK